MKSPVLIMGEIPVEITAKIPDDITLTLHRATFLEKTPDSSNRGDFTVEFLLG